ncbi:hypothetical protein J2W42_006575 [Rhizobium tibeticum]|nr:hypothetical protein [Rhizobium tibeticum]
MRIDERAVFQFTADHDVTSDRNALPGGNRIDRMQFLAEAQISGFVRDQLWID